MKKIICWLIGHEPKLNIIKKGDDIIIDKGFLGEEKGKFINVKGLGVFGVWGEYLGKDGKKHIYDQDCHSIKKVGVVGDICKRCGKRIVLVGEIYI